MDKEAVRDFLHNGRLPRTGPLDAVVILSGGMDSTVLAYLYQYWGYNVHALSFNYNQRHNKELWFAAQTAQMLGIRHDVIDLSHVGPLLKGSALTDDSVTVPHGHYTADNMKVTVVPNRNMIMLSMAIGVAVAERAYCVATGVHAGDHAIYPDCRQAFIDEMTSVARVANEGFIDRYFTVDAPFIDKTKADIATIGEALLVNWSNTWSCYEGGAIHCGQCATCVERREAFKLAGVNDPTKYSVDFDESMRVGGIS